MGCMVLRWFYHYKDQILQNYPMLAFAIGDKYIQKYTQSSYADFELEDAIQQLTTAPDVLRAAMMESLSTLVEFILGYEDIFESAT